MSESQPMRTVAVHISLLRKWYSYVRGSCNNIAENVTSRTILAVRGRPAKCRRALGGLLLLMITYGATVEAAHSHGSVTPERSGFAAISDANGSHPDANHSHHRECVICQ